MGLFNKKESEDREEVEQLDSFDVWNERIEKQSRGELRPEDVLGFSGDKTAVEDIVMTEETTDFHTDAPAAEEPDDLEKTQIVDLSHLSEKPEDMEKTREITLSELRAEEEKQKEELSEDAESGPVLPPVTRPKEGDAFADFFAQLDAASKPAADDNEWSRLFDTTGTAKAKPHEVKPEPTTEKEPEPVIEETPVVAIEVPAEETPLAPVTEEKTAEPAVDETPVALDEEPVPTAAPGALYGIRRPVDRAAIDDFFNGTPEEEEPRSFRKRKHKEEPSALTGEEENALPMPGIVLEDEGEEFLSRRELRRKKRAEKRAAKEQDYDDDGIESIPTVSERPTVTDGSTDETLDFSAPVFESTLGEGDGDAVAKEPSRRTWFRKKRTEEQPVTILPTDESGEEADDNIFEIPTHEEEPAVSDEDISVELPKPIPDTEETDEASEPAVTRPDRDFDFSYSAFTHSEPAFDEPVAPEEKPPVDESFPVNAEAVADREESDEHDYDDDYDDEEELDYESISNAAEIKKELLSRKSRLTLRAIVTALLTVAMLFINGYFFESQRFDNLREIANIINLILLSVTMLVNYRSFANLFSGLLTTDLCADAVTVAVLLQSAVSLICFGSVGAGLGALAGFVLFISILAKRAVCRATLKSLCVIATAEQKQVLTVAEGNAVADEIAAGAVEEEAAVCYEKSAVNLHGFLKQWYHPTPADGRALRHVIVGAVVGLLLAVASALVLKCSAGEASAVFVLALTLICAPSLFLQNSLPLKLMIDGLTDYDATVAGFRGAEELARSNVAALSALDLFPAGSLILQNMLPISANAIDSSILKAAALARKGESPLANIFLDILRDEAHALPTVEHLKYENKLGLSGWVDDEFVLIGSRVLLENHNIAISVSPEVDRKIMAAGYKPVYLAIGGKPCLLFVVQYRADTNVKYELHRLVSAGTVLSVHTTDANITKKLICDCFDLMDDEVYLMSGSGAAKLARLSEFEESVEGYGVSKGKSCGMIAALSSSIRLFSVSAVMRVFHILGILAGLAVLTFLLYTRGFSATVFVLTFLVQIVFLFLNTVIPYLKRP